MRYLQHSTMAYSSIFSFYHDEIDMHIVFTHSYYVDSPVFLFLLDQCGNRFRLIDNLDSRRMDNIPDIPRLSTNEKAGVGCVAAESGRIVVKCSRAGIGRYPAASPGSSENGTKMCPRMYILIFLMFPRK